MFCLATIAYFSYHAVNGDFGMRALARMQAEEIALRQELDERRAERQAMELRVTLLRPESLDPDMLEERARETLNYAHPNELTILRGPR